MRIKKILILVLVLFMIGGVSALPIVPELHGFGTDTRAAYGLAPQTNPTIYRVTSLGTSTSTPGTFGYALTRSGPRLIVFEVSGTIDGPAGGVYHYVVDDPYVTVAGQTAPSPGITLKGIKLIIHTHDVLMQHIRFRLGDALKPGEGLSWLQNRDCINIGNSVSSDAYNVVIDHCSFSWSMDENVEIWESYGGDVYDITISDSITSEGLYRNVRCDYDPVYSDHSKGLLVGYGSTNISILGNLLAHNEGRNPVVYDGTSTVANNLIYNPMNWGVDAKAFSAPVKTGVVGNVVIPGLNSGIYVDEALSIASHLWSPWYNDGVGSEVYVSDNQCVNCGGDAWNGVDDRGNLEPIVRVESAPVWPTDFTAMQGSEVRSSVLSNAGARPTDRDQVDTRIISDAIDGTGSIIDSQSEVGGWPVLAENTQTLTLPTNPHSDDDSDGYTNLEEWIHGFSCDVEGPQSSSCLVAPLTCQSENYNCCDSCESNPQSLYDGDCPGVCCGVCVTPSACGDADSDFSGVVSITELINYITGWKAGNVNINDLINGITEWKNGC